MSENIKNWLLNMLNDELDEINGAISNEKLIIKGCSNQFELDMHLGNLIEFYEYKEVLTSMIEDVEEQEY